MASQTTDPRTAGQDPIAFEVERVALAQPGRLEVTGRWYGVRGRRFVRPELILPSGDGERRWLADLDHKPWSAADGAEWMAVFALDTELDEISGLELSVAPDITVRLADGRPTTGKWRRRRSTDAILRAPRVRSDAAPPSRTLTERAQELERLNAKLIARDRELETERARQARMTEELERERTRRVGQEEELERERARRTATAKELEEERAEAMRLRSQVGLVEAELEIIRAAQVDDAAISAELENVGGELRQERAEVQRLRGQLLRERSAAAAPETQKFQGVTPPQSPEPADHEEQRSDREPREDRPGRQDEALLAQRRREPVRRRDRALAMPRESHNAAGPEEAARRATDREADPAARREAERAARLQERDARREAQREKAQREKAQREEAQREAKREARLAESARRQNRAVESARRDGQPPGSRSHSGPRPERPIHPALSGRTNWLGRMMALLLIVAVLVAIYLVIKSTVSL